jgi:hypothetical protein
MELDKPARLPSGITWLGVALAVTTMGSAMADEQSCNANPEIRRSLVFIGF